MTSPRVPAISLGDLTKSFGDVHAVRGIDLQIEPGEIVAFLGPNGAGKTTTIDMLLGLSRPTDGSVEVLGLPPRQAIARGLVSAVMQTDGLLKDLTVRETVEYTASPRRAGSRTRRAGCDGGQFPRGPRETGTAPAFRRQGCAGLPGGPGNLATASSGERERQREVSRPVGPPVRQPEPGGE